MQIGIGIPNQVRDVNAAIIPEWSSRAEAAGFNTLGTIGRFAYPGVSDTVALAAAAGATSTIGLFSGVLLATVWPAELLAKELAGIDGISGGRLTPGLGIGGRPDDFVVDGAPLAGRGKRFDHDLEVYREIWQGAPVGGGPNPAVPAGTRELPFLFGGSAPVAMARMAKWGQGYVGGSMPASMVAGAFDGARAAWKEAGREGEPRLVAVAYFAFADGDKGRANVYDYYSFLGDQTANFIASAASVGPDAIKATIAAFAEIGTDELMLNPTLADLDEIAKLADVAL
ncbi:MAG TPA: LLM class flavin-dependent oxidoreductase [Pseudonocardiaceae bacterium]|jgi:alkanesulfonate monooxygenase SsuD/methylene tetrahydromethanopterin reductase-like flavin-dependent oxidoreductase (luciferase family)|nr:LLM class flavin-dependent oxidoreductase [Pseudonocardiaceae bacterium]